jgi:hypothetical protein
MHLGRGAKEWSWSLSPLLVYQCTYWCGGVRTSEFAAGGAGPAAGRGGSSIGAEGVIRRSVIVRPLRKKLLAQCDDDENEPVLGVRHGTMQQAYACGVAVLEIMQQAALVTLEVFAPITKTLAHTCNSVRTPTLQPGTSAV